MNKLRRYFPLVILLLVLAFFLFPSQNSAVAPSADPSAAVSSDTLSLATSSPNASSRPTAAPSTPKAEAPAASSPSSDAAPEEEQLLPEDGSYTTKEDVSLYLVQYGHLPSNFITKKEAQKAGWSGGSLEKILPGKCIGGDRFGNYEGLLPAAKGRTWTECDINTLGAKSRGPERIVFSNDGLIYYTGDHYDSFTQLY